MKILIFEFATATGLDDPELLFEGRAMLEGMLDDFDSMETPASIHYLIAEKFLTSEYRQRWKAQPLILNQTLDDWLDNNISKFDSCIFVAAEENMELYKFTRKIEENGVKIIGSDSESVMICSDKLKTFNVLKAKVPVITTYKLFLDDLKNDQIPSKYEFLLDTSDANSLTESNSSQGQLKVEMVVKPADGVACQGIWIVNSWDDIKEASRSIGTSLPYVILQDFIEGESCSVSLLSSGEKALPLSLNRQMIKFTDEGLEYGGGEVPWNHPLSREAMLVAKNAVETIKGLKGYVGVDLIISDKIHLVEINSRLTTPYVALRKLTDCNFGQLILDAAQGSLPDLVDFKGSITFEKSHDKLDIQHMVFK